MINGVKDIKEGKWWRGEVISRVINEVSQNQRGNLENRERSIMLRAQER